MRSQVGQGSFQPLQGRGESVWASLKSIPGTACVHIFRFKKKRGSESKNGAVLLRMLIDSGSE